MIRQYAPAGARNRRKATVKIRRNPPLHILPLIQNKCRSKGTLIMSLVEEVIILFGLEAQLLLSYGISFYPNIRRHLVFVILTGYIPSK